MENTILRSILNNYTNIMKRAKTSETAYWLIFKITETCWLIYKTSETAYWIFSYLLKYTGLLQKL